MRIDIITAVPALLESPFGQSIMKRARDKGYLEVHVHNLHDYSKNKYRQVDDYQFGGGAGMVMMVEPIDKCISELKLQRTYDEVIYMTPDGEQWTQGMANSYSLKENLIILCGHYKGVDERVRQMHITSEISRRACRRHSRRQYSKADTRSAGRRAIGSFRQFPGRSAFAAGVHQTGRVQGIESASGAYGRKPQRDRQLAHGTGAGTHPCQAPGFARRRGLGVFVTLFLT